MTADVLVAGGGLGGVAAALACARRGVPCVVCEPGPVLGGQLTAQAVPPDEHPCVERRGVTASYRALREAILERYRRHEPLTAATRARRRSATASRPTAAAAVVTAPPATAAEPPSPCHAQHDVGPR